VAVETGGLLELNGLARRYGTVTALDGLSFLCRRVGLLVFLGPNGTGKRTTMRGVSG